MLLKRYNITISEKNVSRAVIKQDIKDMYEANKAILVKLFNEKINQVEELDRIDTTELRNISRDTAGSGVFDAYWNFPAVCAGKQEEGLVIALYSDVGKTD